MGTCSIYGCNKNTIARGYCKGHYQNYRRYGDARFKNKQDVLVNGRVKRKCRNCEIIKPLSSFAGRGIYCPQCKREKYLESNKNANKKYRESNREILAEKRREYYQENKEFVDKRSYEWRKGNGEEYWRDYHNTYIRNKYHTDPIYKEAQLIRKRVMQAYRKWEETGEFIQSKSKTKPINFEDVIKHLGPCPGEIGKKPGKWTIDHIIPLRSLNLLNPLEYKIAVHEWNHIWCKWEDNLGRHNYITDEDDMEIEILYNLIIEDILFQNHAERLEKQGMRVFNKTLPSGEEISRVLDREEDEEYYDEEDEDGNAFIQS